MDIKFSPAIKKDIPTVFSFMKAFYAIDQYPFDKKNTEECLNEFIDDSSLGKIWIIKNGKNTIGYVVLTYGYSFEFHGKNAVIDELYIEKEYRNQGIGTKAIDYVLKKAKKNGIKAVHLEVETHNEPGKKIYKKFNFKTHKRTLMTCWL
jgi:diamine N-acetyltransferase